MSDHMDMQIDFFVNLAYKENADLQYTQYKSFWRENICQLD